MALTAGIIGLPNVGKSTLFNAITKLQVPAANYPFATINPNIGVVEVPDYRLKELAKIVMSNVIISTTFEFTDIAGLVKGASKGEGLGNKFLDNIRNVDAICHVVRCFDNKDITHIETTIDPVRDIEIVNLELILKDLSATNARLNKIEKKVIISKDNIGLKEVAILKKVNIALEKEILLSQLSLSTNELKLLKPLNLITIKPVLYVLNISENNINSPDSNPYVQKAKAYAKKQNNDVVVISAQIESELALLTETDQKVFMNDLAINELGLNYLIKTAYHTLNLQTYFTANQKEVRAWTFQKGMTAPVCAGLIHTDFTKGFIRAEIMKYKDLITFKSEGAVKEAGKWYSEGRDYLMQDGDVVLFRFNV